MYTILFKVVTSSQYELIKRQLSLTGFVVYPGLIHHNTGTYTGVVFGGSFTGKKPWMEAIDSDCYVYLDEMMTFSHSSPISQVSALPLRVTRFENTRQTEPTPVSMCSVCGTPIYTGGIVDTHGNPLCNMCHEGWVRCENCGLRVPPENTVTYTPPRETIPQSYCDACWESISQRCVACGEQHIRQYMSAVDGLSLCNTCFNDDSVTTLCSRCQTRHFPDDFESDGHIIVCSRCRHSLTRCAGCSRFIIPESHEADRDELDGRWWCKDCKPNDRKLFGYYRYTPPLTFYKTSQYDFSPVFGIEIEMTRGDRMAVLRELVDVDEVWCKRDGSISSSSGIELVTHPCSYEYLMQKFPWKKVLSTCISNGYVSHDDPACGMHIHISKDLFGERYETTVLKAAWITYKYWDKIVRFTRRSNETIDSWAMRYNVCREFENQDTLTEENAHRLISTGRGNKYMCLNIIPDNTLEARIFRGSLNLETIIASVQFCMVLIGLQNVSLLNVYKMTWEEFFNRCIQYPELKSYMARRGITKDETLTPATVERETWDDNVIRSLRDIISGSSGDTLTWTSDEGEHHSQVLNSVEIGWR